VKEGYLKDNRGIEMMDVEKLKSNDIIKEKINALV
jgi:hypothetical protein